MDINSLIQAVQYGDIRNVKEFISGRTSPNTTDADGCSLLHWAAINNRVSIALYLIERGADVNIQGGLLSETPLHWAIRKDFYRIVQLLLDHGASSSVKSNLGQDALHLAVQLGNIEMVFLLLSLGADPNTFNQEGDTPLMTVINNHKQPLALDMIRLLLRMGSDVAIQNPSNGNNAIHAICLNRQRAAVVAAFLLFTSPGGSVAAQTQNHYNSTPWQVDHMSCHYHLFIHLYYTYVHPHYIFTDLSFLLTCACVQVVQETRYAEMARLIYDLYLYHHFPAWLPSLGALLSFAAFFPCVEYLGWMWGLVAYVVLHTCLFDKMMQATIESRLSKVNQGSATAMVLGLVVNHAMYVQQYTPINSSAAFYLLVILTLILMYKVTMTPAQRARGLLTTDRYIKCFPLSLCQCLGCLFMECTGRR